jgi:hypothetical protein
MTRQITIHNCETNEVTTRDMTAEEIKAQDDLNKEQIALKAAKDKAKADAEAKLAALGLTTDDLKALGL